MNLNKRQESVVCYFNNNSYKIMLDQLSFKPGVRFIYLAIREYSLAHVNFNTRSLSRGESFPHGH